ncbi:MAG: hypothetical protein HZC28_10810 [Spirochaetes bacterium]|nr:hypothetical protein [Spirochaetota bacterium]
MTKHTIITIKKVSVKARYKFIWLKSIEGLDMSKHCAAGLIGSTYTTRVMHEEIINKSSDKHLTLRSRNGLYYLCGVSEPYIWKKNFHLPFKYAENKLIQFESNGIEVETINAERIELHDVNRQKCRFPGAHFPEYYTCRNWQFANMLINNEIEGYFVKNTYGYCYEVRRGIENDFFAEMDLRNFK